MGRYMSSTASERQDSLVKAAWVGIVPSPKQKKGPPLKENTPPREVFIIRGTFLANLLKTKFFKPIKHPQKPSKINDNPKSYNNSYIISYKFLIRNLLKDSKTLKINEIPTSYNNFLYYFI